MMTFSWFLFPIAIFPKVFTNYLLDSFAQIALPIFGLYILIKLFLQPRLMDTLLPSNNTLKLWSSFIIVQLTLMTYLHFEVGDSVHVYGLVHGLLAFLNLIIVILVAYIVQKIAIQNYNDALRFLKSVLITLACYLILVVFPQLLYIVGFHSIGGYVNTVASLFERHWAERDFYNLGSYVATLGRANGFEPEAPFLANLLGLVFSPLLIMLVQEPIKNFKNKPWVYWGIWGLIGSVLVTMALAKTTTGFVLIGLLGLIFLITAPRKQKLFFGSLTIFAVIAVIVAYFVIPSVTNLLNTWLFQKSGTDNRLGGSIGLFRTWLSHPIFGVGFGNEGYFVDHYLPDWSKNNLEYQFVYSKTAYPILNDMLGWLARYGLVFVLLVFWLTLGLIKRALFIIKSLRFANDSQSVFYRVVMKSFIITVLLIIIMASITQINQNSWPLLLILFFYWRVLILAEEKLALR